MEMEGVEASLAPGSSEGRPEPLPITVSKPIPYTFDLGNLLCTDANIVPPQPTNADIAAISRDCAQGLLNQLLTTCAISHSSTEGTVIRLPPATTPIPREKPLPTEKSETKWERFARKKGIRKKARGEGKLTYDDEKGDWVPKWGYKGKIDDDDWIVEVDDKKEMELKDGETVRGAGRREKAENAKRNERRQRANERKARKARAAA